MIACLLACYQSKTDKKYATMCRRLSLNTCSQNGVLLTLLPDREGEGLSGVPMMGVGEKKALFV